MGNIRKTLERLEAFYGEPVEAIVVGVHDSRRSGDDDPRADENVILSRDDGLRKLDEEYNSGYGGADCYPMFAWAASRVFFVSEYDGATCISYLPRNPIAIEPQFSGRDPGFDEIARIAEARQATPLADRPQPLALRP